MEQHVVEIFWRSKLLMQNAEGFNWFNYRMNETVHFHVYLLNKTCSPIGIPFLLLGAFCIENNENECLQSVITCEWANFQCIISFTLKNVIEWLVLFKNNSAGMVCWRRSVSCLPVSLPVSYCQHYASAFSNRRTEIFCKICIWIAINSRSSLHTHISNVMDQLGLNHVGQVTSYIN